MPVVAVPETSLAYYLIAFDKDGKERSESDGFMSQKVLDVLSKEPITDVFLISHGWLSDVHEAKKQYNGWIKAMADNHADIEKMKELRPGYCPLMIGLHWPSKPLENESLELTTDPAKAKNLTKFEEEVIKTRNGVQSLTSDWENDFSSEEGFNLFNYIKQQIKEKKESFTKGIDKKLTEFLSYWDMKERARQIGQTSGFKLLTKLQKQTNDQVRFHLIGHSFGTIVVSAMLRGPEVDSKLVRPVNSLSLIQGAVSLWSFCEKVPERENLMGYFRPIVSGKKVAGPIVTTNSQKDYSVKYMYPFASKIGLKTRGQEADFPGVNLPVFGGIGTWGIQGSGLDIDDIVMKTTDKEYKFKTGWIYNLNSDKFIQDGIKDAHCAIAKPEVAHAVWSAAFGII
ncbi:MAG: hypothetical protein QNJ55_35495 [Xenococcus sp. MO_188.B8]|nr:hypothetical protein [Xenococcus sp. MO_188.B8]